jgi:MoaA/NifB/PqqE/SkfB family radical SAM enzyme
MAEEVFSRLVADLREFPSPPDVFFGGYGEPLYHPDILDMISRVSALGSQADLVTNGTLLTPHLVESLVDAGLRKLWISVDSSHQDALLSSRTGELQTNIIDLLAKIQRQGNGLLEKLQPGLALVLTRNNKTGLMDLLDQGRKLGIESYFISNLEAYTVSLAQEVPYSLDELRHPGAWSIANSGLIENLEKFAAENPKISIQGTLTHPGSICPFAERGELVVRWDGEISPCLPLLYDRTTYIGSWEHKQFSHSLGKIPQRSLREIWADSEYSFLRKRLLNNEFSPCLDCRDCWLSEDNLLDCMGFEHPTCGGCLWAEGLISCP